MFCEDHLVPIGCNLREWSSIEFHLTNVLNDKACLRINHVFWKLFLLNDCKTFKIQIKFITCWTNWASLSLHTCKDKCYLFEEVGTCLPSHPASQLYPQQQGGKVRKGRSQFQSNLNLAKLGWLRMLRLPPKKPLLLYQRVSPETFICIEQKSEFYGSVKKNINKNMALAQSL